MGYRELSRMEIVEVVRRWQKGESQRAIARGSGAARETVSLALTQLRQQNLLRTGRNQLLFNPEALRNFTRAQRKHAQAG